jgi:SAM-dependent methyltransferase
LERIIRASSNPGDLVADFFCGSGTTPLVAASLGRRFIATDATLRAVHTTRSRLTGVQIPFTLERDSASPFPLQPYIADQSEDITIEQEDGVLHLSTSFDLDYWEVDPAWDGKIFRSAAQALRPARSEELPDELKIKTGSNACIRLVTVQGEQFQLNV